MPAGTAGIMKDGCGSACETLLCNGACWTVSLPGLGKRGSSTDHLPQGVTATEPGLPLYCGSCSVINDKRARCSATSLLLLLLSFTPHNHLQILPPCSISPHQRLSQVTSRLLLRLAVSIRSGLHDRLTSGRPSLKFLREGASRKSLREEN